MLNIHEWSLLLASGLCALCLIGCVTKAGSGSPAAKPVPTPARAPHEVSRQSFGKTKEGTPVDLFTLKNKHGVEVKISNYGGTVISWLVPDRNGRMADVVLGYDHLEGYLTNSPFFGCLVGRFANRIARGKFTLNGQEYSLPINNGLNSLHGGLRGFDKRVWDAKIIASGDEPSLELAYVSQDGEEGFPGTLTVKAAYALTDDNALRLEYTAKTDKDTIVNLTQHSYFNLAGQGDNLNHVVMIPASQYVPIDSTLIPTGDLAPVAGTPFDFQKPVTIGSRINEDHEQLKFAKGYDHTWVIDKPMGKLGLCARVSEPTTGRVLEVFSTEPGVQFYSGNFLNGTIKGKYGHTYNFRNGFCLEPQHFPDSPNQPKFPSVVLKPGQVYKNTIIYRLSVGP
jgi:aldose 1-epimerase